jgi:hypothetical protein
LLILRRRYTNDTWYTARVLCQLAAPGLEWNSSPGDKFCNNGRHLPHVLKGTRGPNKLKPDSRCSNNRAEQLATVKVLEVIESLVIAEDGPRTATTYTESRITLDSLKEHWQPRPSNRRHQEENVYLGEIEVDDRILVGQGPCRNTVFARVICAPAYFAHPNL